MMYPGGFHLYTLDGGFDIVINLRDKWLLLIIIQMVMFGMGIQMKLEDFTAVKENRPRRAHWFNVPLLHYAIDGVTAYKDLSF